jgi:hypothetical protein
MAMVSNGNQKPPQWLSTLMFEDGLPSWCNAVSIKSSEAKPVSEGDFDVTSLGRSDLITRINVVTVS